MKESYIKAIGIGLGFNLQRIEFHPKTLALQQGVVTTDTEFYLDGKLDTTWAYHESKLDDLHFVCVALKKPHGVSPDFFFLALYLDCTYCPSTAIFDYDHRLASCIYALAA